MDQKQQDVSTSLVSEVTLEMMKEKQLFLERKKQGKYLYGQEGEVKRLLKSAYPQPGIRKPRRLKKKQTTRLVFQENPKTEAVPQAKPWVYDGTMIIRTNPLTGELEAKQQGELPTFFKKSKK